MVVLGTFEPSLAKTLTCTEGTTANKNSSSGQPVLVFPNQNFDILSQKHEFPQKQTLHFQDADFDRPRAPLWNEWPHGTRRVRLAAFSKYGEGRLGSYCQRINKGNDVKSAVEKLRCGLSRELLKGQHKKCQNIRF